VTRYTFSSFTYTLQSFGFFIFFIQYEIHEKSFVPHHSLLSILVVIGRLLYTNTLHTTGITAVFEPLRSDIGVGNWIHCYRLALRAGRCITNFGNDKDLVNR
jgi:hypothetical protein